MRVTSTHIDALKELINVGVGRAAGVLNEMLNTHIGLRAPEVVIGSRKELRAETAAIAHGSVAAIQLRFEGRCDGCASLVFSQRDASILVAALTGEERGSSDLDSVAAGTLSEVGNIVLNSVMGSLSNALAQQFKYSLPDYAEGDIDAIMPLTEETDDVNILSARTRFTIEKYEIEGIMLLLLEGDSFLDLLGDLDEIVGTAGGRS